MRLNGCISPVFFWLSYEMAPSAHSSIRLTTPLVYGSKYLGQKCAAVVKSIDIC